MNVKKHIDKFLQSPYGNCPCRRFTISWQETDEAWVIPFCVEELKKLNKKLEDYSPSNPEIQEFTMQEVVFRLALEMRVQNNIMAQALLALNLKKPVNIEDNA